MEFQNQTKVLLERLVPMSREAVLKAYRGWAPVYDWTFGILTRPGRRQAIARVNRHGGLVLDVGVGTGLSLPRYASGVEVVGMDLSPDMLNFAQARLRRDRPGNVRGLVRNDAAMLAFADDSFDVVVAMVVLSAATDPETMMSELIRVLKPGCELILVSHFSHNNGWRGWLEKMLAPHGARLGWRPDFPILPFVERSELALTTSRRLSPLGMFTLLSFRKNHDRAPQPASQPLGNSAQDTAGGAKPPPPVQAGTPKSQS